MGVEKDTLTYSEMMRSELMDKKGNGLEEGEEGWMKECGRIGGMETVDKGKKAATALEILNDDDETT